jgi:hypothetical protein
LAGEAEKLNRQASEAFRKLALRVDEEPAFEFAPDPPPAKQRPRR